MAVSAAAEVDSAEAVVAADESEGVVSAAEPVRAAALVAALDLAADIVVVLGPVMAVAAFRVPARRHAHQSAALRPTVVRRFVRRRPALVAGRDPALVEEESARGIAPRCNREAGRTSGLALARSARGRDSCLRIALPPELVQEPESAVGQVERLEFPTSRLAEGLERTCPVPVKDFRIAAERAMRLGIVPRNQRPVCPVWRKRDLARGFPTRERGFRIGWGIFRLSRIDATTSAIAWRIATTGRITARIE